MTTDNMNNIDFLLDITPYAVISEFERQHFHDQTSVAFSRHIINTVNRIRKIVSDLEQDMGSFERQCLVEEKQKLEDYLNSQDSATLKLAVENWQQVEEDYWADHLGKIAAIELITYGKPTMETMTKMVKLPEELYIKATQICVRLANAIKETTVKAEEEIGVFNQQPMPEQSTSFDVSVNPAIKKLLLKKVK